MIRSETLASTGAAGRTLLLLLLALVTVFACGRAVSPDQHVAARLQTVSSEVSRTPIDMEVLFNIDRTAQAGTWFDLGTRARVLVLNYGSAAERDDSTRSLPEVTSYISEVTTVRIGATGAAYVLSDDDDFRARIAGAIGTEMN